MCKPAILIGFPIASLPPFQRGVGGDGERGSRANVEITPENYQGIRLFAGNL